MQELLGKLMGGLVGRYLDGYKTTIGGVCLVLYGLVLVAGHIWPDAGLPGAGESWEAAFGTIGAGLAALGVTHKVYKAGLMTPTPPQMEKLPRDPLGAETEKEG